jgi:outer membrane immunogenic protein
VNAGGTFSGSSRIALTPSSDFGPFPSGFASAHAIGAYPTFLTSRRTGFIGGGQVGFNYQFGMFVAGFEADIQGLPQRNTVSATLFNPALPPANFSAAVFGTATMARRLDYLGTARRRGSVPLSSTRRAVSPMGARTSPIPGRSVFRSPRRSF